MLSQRRRQYTLSWHFVGKLMNIQYLNHPPYPKVYDNTDLARSRAASLAVRQMINC